MSIRIGIIVFIFLITGGAIYFFTQDNNRAVSHNNLTNFAIKDTASITKIFIASSNNEAVTLERQPDGNWLLNGQYQAKKGEDGMKLVLKTINELQVKSPVPKSAKETIIKRISAKHKKVELYKSNEQTPFKTYWIGDATQDHFGTYALLETREEGISASPYIIETKGSTGYITPRFFVKEDEWRFTGIFNYPKLGISEITMNYPETPEASFSVKLNEGNVSLYSGNGTALPKFNETYVKDFILQFKKLHFEIFERDLNYLQVDSLKKTPVYCEVNVKDHQNQTKKLIVHQKKKYDNENLEGLGPNKLWDANYYYGILETGEPVLLQRYVFRFVFVPITTFIDKEN